jgi:hypothetical protein
VPVKPGHAAAGLHGESGGRHIDVSAVVASVTHRSR